MHNENYNDKGNERHNWEMYYIHLLETSILLRCQFFPNWSIYSKQSQSKFQEDFCRKQDNSIIFYHIILLYSSHIIKLKESNRERRGSLINYAETFGYPNGKMKLF